MHFRYVLSLLVAFASLSIASCSTMQAGSDHYPGADFTRYRSFAWIADPPLIHAQSALVQISQLHIRRVRESIQRELTAKGFELVSVRENADFAVSFTVGARDMIRVEDYPPFYRRRPWRWGPPYYWPNVDVYMYTEGMLGIDVFDNESGEPVWHGWARKRIVGRDVDDPDVAIDAAVNAILADFPPA